MEEKISVERPRPFSSGYILPFYTKQKTPVLRTIQTTSVEYIRDLRRLAMDTRGAKIESLEMFAREALVQKNKLWFKNQLTDDAVRAMVQRSVNPEGFMMVRFSPDHLPKAVYVNDQAVTDWETMEKVWLCPANGVAIATEMVTVELVCHGLYLTKQRAELLWKIQKLSVYTSESGGGAVVNVDEHKADIEAYWGQELEKYGEAMRTEIRQWTDKIRRMEDKHRRLVDLLDQCKKYSSSDPEWNKTIQHIQYEISQKNYFI
jgi:hypothetical protein